MIRTTIRPSFKLSSLALSSLLLSVTANSSFAVDDGSQMANPFRVNYAGYLPQASKIGIYVAPRKGAVQWKLQGAKCSGKSDTYVANDKSSGDSFYIIDFSTCTSPVTGARLAVGKDVSAPFDIAADPYGPFKFTLFKYFKDHESTNTFNQAVNNWEQGLSINFTYVRDAGDNGAYPANTAESAWSLINLLETYPAVNTYYSTNLIGSRTVYDQLRVLTEQFNVAMNNSRNLAIPKFHANVNDTHAKCPPHATGTCISEPETKATFSVARGLAAMSRMHSVYGSEKDATAAYSLAKTAFANARKQPNVCNQADKFGGEGGYYPDSDNYSSWRDPKKLRDNCFPDKDNTQDDEYEALVELYLTAEKFKNTAEAATFKAEVLKNPRFNEVASFSWSAVSTEGGLSLLANEGRHSIDLTVLKANILAVARVIGQHQSNGYPATWDPNGTQWNIGDQDDKDNNVRWGSNRNALNDARILMAAAEIQKAKGQPAEAARFSRDAIKVLDYIFGVNAMNIAMVTAGQYSFLENAVQRTHDAMDPKTLWPGKMVNGPNNWTNANDKDMPAFASQPPLKMFAATGTGWASREISIDCNAALVPVAYFATEVAPAILALDPIGKTTKTSK